jgi:serine/threonine protein kinase
MDFLVHCSYKLIPKNVDHVALEEHFRRQCGYKVADPRALDLLKKMLSLDPAQRPTATECLKHAYFTDPTGEREMTEEQFMRLTHGMASCHEYSIKQRQGKRARREDDAAGSPPHLRCLLEGRIDSETVPIVAVHLMAYS